MATTKTRINITLSDEMREALAELARRERVPQATKAVKLLAVGLELEEDQAWDTLANKRDIHGARYFSHDKAWK